MCRTSSWSVSSLSSSGTHCVALPFIYSFINQKKITQPHQGEEQAMAEGNQELAAGRAQGQLCPTAARQVLEGSVDSSLDFYPQGVP